MWLAKVTSSLTCMKTTSLLAAQTPKYQPCRFAFHYVGNYPHVPVLTWSLCNYLVLANSVLNKWYRSRRIREFW